MPEGPSIVILKEAVAKFAGRKVLAAEGSALKQLPPLTGKTVKGFASWGKHFLVCFNGFAVRVHFLLFGSYTIDEPATRNTGLHLRFRNGELHLYSNSIRLIEEDLNEVYDWSADVMSERWDASRALKKLKEHPDMLVCDALMNQDFFSGVGNIIKNEVLFRIGVHPESRLGALSAAKRKALVKEAVAYSHDFLEWKKAGKLKANWKVYHKRVCPRDQAAVKQKQTGKSARRSYFCTRCQVLYR